MSFARLIESCEYYAKCEPSSPIPLLLKGAKRLASMNFLEIVREIQPEGLEQLRDDRRGNRGGLEYIQVIQRSKKMKGHSRGQRKPSEIYPAQSSAARTD